MTKNTKSLWTAPSPSGGISLLSSHSQKTVLNVANDPGVVNPAIILVQGKNRKNTSSKC